jgi:discoidin domain receptor family protein 2
VEGSFGFHALTFALIIPGNGWVAWRNDSFPNNYVEMVFEFDQVRNFSALHVFTNNFFTKNVQVLAI